MAAFRAIVKKADCPDTTQDRTFAVNPFLATALRPMADIAGFLLIA